MKPKSELQKRIVSLSERLPQISQKHKDYAFDKCFEKYVTISRNTLYCLECGHSWKPGHSSLVTSVAGETCPDCNKVLKFCCTYRRFMREYKYFGLLTTKQNMQVVDTFFY